MYFSSSVFFIPFRNVYRPSPTLTKTLLLPLVLTSSVIRDERDDTGVLHLKGNENSKNDEKLKGMRNL